MIPLRLIIDTNIVVSAALKPDGLQRTVLLLAMSKPARLYVSDDILAEHRDVLARRELKIRKGLRLQILQLIKTRSQTVMPSRGDHLARIPQHCGAAFGPMSNVGNPGTNDCTVSMPRRNRHRKAELI
jgi:hypothetical protein